MLFQKNRYANETHDNFTHTWPISWAIVNAAARPLSWTIAHEDLGEHIRPNSANPKVSQFLWSELWQRFSL